MFTGAGIAAWLGIRKLVSDDQRLQRGSISFGGDLGSGLRFCGLSARPRTCGLGAGLNRDKQGPTSPGRLQPGLWTPAVWGLFFSGSLEVFLEDNSFWIKLAEAGEGKQCGSENHKIAPFWDSVSTAIQKGGPVKTTSETLARPWILRPLAEPQPLLRRPPAPDQPQLSGPVPLNATSRLQSRQGMPVRPVRSARLVSRGLAAPGARGWPDPTWRLTGFLGLCAPAAGLEAD